MPYFDHNATTPLALAAREAWLQAVDQAWQNPSSPYRDAARVKLRLDAARERFAALLGAKADQVVFNSGATEGAHAVFAQWARTLPAGSRVALNPAEHPCVLAAAETWFPGRIEWLPTNGDGVIAPEALATRLAGDDRPPTAQETSRTDKPHGPADAPSAQRPEEPNRPAAVAIMAANNETGVIQPWAELARVCRRAGVSFLCDASQWLGKLPAAGFGEVDWVIGSAHKFGGPKGTGFVKRAAHANGFRSQPGGEQEHGHRGGTEDFPGIAAMVAALAHAEQAEVFLETERLRWRERFEREMALALPGVQVVGAGADRLWNTVSLLMPAGENSRWVARLDKRGFQVSTGSACATGQAGPSHVLSALGFRAEEARRVVRVSSGWQTSEADWVALAEAMAAVRVEVAPATAVISL